MISPDDPAWLRELIGRSPLLPDPALRAHWRRVIPWLSTSARYELASALLSVEHAFDQVPLESGAPQ